MEIQIRTAFQDDWAQLSEALADRYGEGVKYGTADPRIVEELRRLSEHVRNFEVAEHRNLLRALPAAILAQKASPGLERPELDGEFEEAKRELRVLLRTAARSL